MHTLIGNMSTTTNKFVIAQLSDLHCSDAQLLLGKPNHKHDPDMLKGVEQAFKTIQSSCDRVLVTGDLSNYGDDTSLRFAKMWLTQRVGLPGGEHTGLSLPPPLLRVIPGNHDAWNNSRTGVLAIRLQRAVENYNREFPDHQMPATGYTYDWIEKGNDGIYMVFLNSCHLADSDKYPSGDKKRSGLKFLRSPATEYSNHK